MENIRVFEENGYIHFIMRPEDLMRLRYSTEAKTPFADFMDRWLTQMKTQVRENTMDGYRYAFEKHIKPFFTARGTTLATARPMDFQDFVNAYYLGYHAGWNAFSDKRLKYVGNEFVSGLDKIKQLKVFNYTFKDDKRKHLM